MMEIQRRPQRKAAIDSVFNDNEPTWTHTKKNIKEKTNWESFVDSIAVSFTLSLPLDFLKYYPQQFAFFFGTICYCIFGFLFFYFMVTGFQRQLEQEFISLDRNAGDCSDVEQSLTMRVMASRSGNWETDPDFHYSDAFMQLKLNKLSVNEAEFENLIGRFGNLLNDLGTEAAASPFIINVLTWMHFKSHIVVGDRKQEMQFKATPNDVYNHRHIVTTVGSKSGLCSAPSYSWFDVPSSHLVIEWNAPEYMASGCESVGTLESLGWEDRDGNQTVVKIDTVSTSTAMATNLGIVAASELETMGEEIHVYKSLYMTRRFDPAYPRMRPLFCFQKKNDGNMDTESVYSNITNTGVSCFVDFASQVAIPVVHHYLPGCRDCQGPTNYSKYSDEHYCDVFDVMLGLVYYPGPAGLGNPQVKKEWTEAVGLYYSFDSFEELSESTFYPIYDMSNTEEDPSAYDFCGDCQLLGVNIWDEDTFLSEYFLSINPSHCVDTFSLQADNLNALATNPPVTLVEPYLRCRMYPEDAFISSVGIAAGNLGAFGPLALIFFVLPLIYLYFTYVSEEEAPVQKYDLVKIMKAQREFIETVLGANDGTLDGISQDSIIHKLGVELYHLAQYEEGKEKDIHKGYSVTNFSEAAADNADNDNDVELKVSAAPTPSPVDVAPAASIVAPPGPAQSPESPGATEGTFD